MFGETVYENADSAPSHHFVFNLANVADVCTHYLFTLLISIPLIMLAIYEMLIYRPLWASKSWILDDLSLLVLVALLTALVAGIIQVAYRITHSQQLYNRWLPWSEELAIITGGASGIGLGLTKCLASCGCRVAVLDVSPAPSAKDEPELNALIDSGRVRYYKCDISDSTQVQSSVDDIQRDFDGDPISILINNAGIVNAKPLEDLSEQEIRRSFGVNCLAHFWTVRSVLPIMKRQRYGHLVTISSTMGLTAVSGMITGFHEAVRQEIRNYGFPHLIHTSMLCPGLILTGMFGGIRIRFPFLVPPLKPEHVVNEVFKCLEQSVCLPWNRKTTKQTLEQCLQRYQPPRMDQWKQHKVIWMPTSYYLLPLLNICCPVWLYDSLKQAFGGNSALTSDFHGRQRSVTTGSDKL